MPQDWGYPPNIQNMREQRRYYLPKTWERTFDPNHKHKEITETNYELQEEVEQLLYTSGCDEKVWVSYARKDNGLPFIFVNPNYRIMEYKKYRDETASSNSDGIFFHIYKELMVKYKYAGGIVRTCRPLGVRHIIYYNLVVLIFSLKDFVVNIFKFKPRPKKNKDVTVKNWLNE